MSNVIIRFLELCPACGIEHEIVWEVAPGIQLSINNLRPHHQTCWECSHKIRNYYREQHGLAPIPRDDWAPRTVTVWS